jgi:hypothetical protein
MMSFMKIRKSLLFFQLLMLSVTSPVFAQEEQQKEYVQVVNVELILRVLKDGSPVGGLKKNDFVLYEDGETCEINGFFENHRRMAHAGESKKQLQQPRLYLLFFWVGNPGADVAGVLEKFFSSVYRAGDRVILSTPLKTFELLSSETIASTSTAFLEQWRQEAKDRFAVVLQFQVDLNRLLEDLVRRLAEDTIENATKEKRGIRAGVETTFATEKDDPKEKEINAFIAQYARTVQEYRLRELSPDISTFEAMARSMLPNKNEKFALVFFQHDSIQLFDIANVKGLCMAKQIPENITNELANAMLKIEEQEKRNFDVHIFSEQLKSLFIQANTQFHLFSLSAYKSDGQANANSFFSLTKSEVIFSKWDHVMNEISKNTGGLRLDGDHMTNALDQAIAFEDIYYHITYVPRGPGAKKRKIDIRVNQPGMQVIYGRTLEMNEMPLVKITEIVASNQLIRLEVVDFYPIPKDGVPTGFVNIDITGKQTDNEPSRLLLSQVSETVGTVELPFAFPQAGIWNLEVRVTDQITGQQDVKKVKAAIAAAIPTPAAESDPGTALSALLARAAAYAEKLKKTAFHFICREELTEDVFSQNSINQNEPAMVRTNWIYDYQIIGQNGKINENRVLLEKNQKPSHQQKAQLETMFHSYFSFYMPVTILAREKQHLYYYRLLSKEKVKNKNVRHIAAVPRSPGSIPWGELWIGEEDGTVLKIQADQTSIIGFDKLAQKAIEQGFMPVITTIHEYDLEKNGINFPSKTTFIERYNPSGESINKSVFTAGMADKERNRLSYERSRTYFEYKHHKFFSISTSVEEKNE